MCARLRLTHTHTHTHRSSVLSTGSSPLSLSSEAFETSRPKTKKATLTFPFTTFTIRKVLAFVLLWTLNHSNELLLNSSNFPVVLFIMRQCAILKCAV